MLKVKLEALDNKVITPRTGKTLVIGEIPYLPQEGRRLTCLYLNEDCESPGVNIETNGIERIGDQIKFYDYEQRPFKITLI